MQAAHRPEETLADVLEASAARTPRTRLALDVAGGLLIAAAAIWARPVGWILLTPVATCLACYGTWALARRRRPLTATPGPWDLIARVAGMLGLGTFVFLLFALLGVALGPLIS